MLQSLGRAEAEAAAALEEVITAVRDLDLDQIRVVRERWQFFRDRHPDAYGPILAP